MWGQQGRDLKYSIYTGIDRAARDLSQMRDHTASRQIERALERVRIIEKGAGTQVPTIFESYCSDCFFSVQSLSILQLFSVFIKECR